MRTMMMMMMMNVVCAWLLGQDIDFEKDFKALQPHDDGPWSAIPWKITLMVAREAAISENKPIFVWALDGHPLGNC